MKIYNTLTRQKETFEPLEPGKVSIYSCGPTVYDYIHIGNARPVVIFDVLRRYFEYKGYQVTFVQNFTDIDDKIINRANEEGVEYTDITRRFIQEYQTDVDGLGVRAPDIAPRATESIDEIIKIVETLVEKGDAYAVDGDVYFRTAEFDEYGKLSRQPLEDLSVGARINPDERKENPLDFVLWKAAKEGEPSWSSPWGQGRPGWHIECSAMVNKHLGPTIDIHTGGQDLIFPHHENEIAQSQCYNNAEYVRYWMHNGHISVDNRKMSKSLGNFFTVRDISDKVGYEPIKFLLLQSHYRSPFNFSEEVMEQSIQGLERLHTSRDNLDFAMENNIDDSNTQGSEEFLATLVQRKQQFEQAMDDDLNTADAISALFELVRDINIYTKEQRPLEDLQAAAELFDTITDVLGILYSREQQDLDSEIEALIEEREEARQARNFAKADEIRDTLAKRGIVLEDTPQGVKYHIKK